MHQIVELEFTDSNFLDHLSRITFLAFKDTAPKWLATEKSALEQVLACNAEHRFGRVCMSGEKTGERTVKGADNLSEGIAIGWIGVIARKHLWEIHPIAVDPDQQSRGIGEQLVEDVARLARHAGVSTLLAATSDETNTTNLYGQNLYLDPAQAIKDLKATGRNPFMFWKSVGFTVVGLVPDEEGRGKPGIQLARRI